MEGGFRDGRLELWDLRAAGSGAPEIAFEDWQGGGCPVSFCFGCESLWHRFAVYAVSL
jgi:hypothetical protein